jgi:release factor glutamine methyltransferase
MNIQEALKFYTKKLSPAYDDQQTAGQVAWWLLEKATEKTRTELLLLKAISEEAQQKIEVWVSQIINEHVPVQYILGSVPFLDLDIIVKAPILIPRPETEQWCQELILQLKKSAVQNFKLLDLCSGTGCIALSIAHAFSEADVTALDINPQACTLIEENRTKNGIENCTIVESDLFEELSKEKKYSIITANPPYITQEEWHGLEPRVKNWESPQALVAHNNGLEIIEKIIAQAPEYLDKKIDAIAQVWIEIGASQAEQVVALFEKAGYRDSVIINDQYGKNRVVTGSL